MNKQKQLVRQIISGELSQRSKSRYCEQTTNNQENNEYGTLQKQDNQEQRRIDDDIKSKFRTFSKWNLRSSLPRSPHKRHSLKQDKSSQQISTTNQSFKLNLSMLVSKNISTGNSPNKNSHSIQTRKGFQTHKDKNRPAHIKLDKMAKNTLPQISNKKINRNISPLPPNLSSKDKNQKKVNTHVISTEQEAVHSDRRQRFKKLKNPMGFIKHYTQNQNFRPEPQQKFLIQKLIGVQKMLQDSSPKLQTILSKIYIVMNMAVDYNELLFLTLLILLAADVCFYMKDVSKAFYFYNQTRLAGSYAHLDKLKISALIGMGKIAFELKQFESSSRIFKKALQYTWRAKESDTELQIYDWLGQTLHFQGNVKDSQYYHQRYINSENQNINSALIKISDDILKQYDNHIYSLQNTNLNSLFIQYLNLPIGGQIETHSPLKKQFKNYKDGQSPRMKKRNKIFAEQFFQDAKLQLYKLLNEDYQFISEIQNPDSQKNEIVIRNFGKPKHQLDFQHSLQYNKIIGLKRETFHMEKVLKLPLQKQVQKMLSEKVQKRWWEKMVEQAKKNRVQKVGTLKQRVRNSHLSIHKYPQERKKNHLWSLDKVNQSFNRTLLDWIDPPNNMSPGKRQHQ